MRRAQPGPGVPDSGAPLPRGANSAAFLLAQVGAHAAARFGERLKRLKLGGPQAGILRLVAAAPGLSQRSLAARLGILPSRLVALLDELETRGLLARRRDGADRRSYALHLTAAGEAAMQRIGRIAREHNEWICAALAPQEREQLSALLRRIAEQQGLAAGVHPGFRSLGRKPAQARERGS